MAAPASSSAPAFGVYVHWPFCLSKCPYCDFNSHVRQAPIDEKSFVEAFRAELAHRANLAPGRLVTSIFFGGGTPSLMKPSTVASILEAISDNWPIARDVEITLEANPSSVEADRFAGYRSAGVNRISLGVQALADADLKALGRLHSVADALGALDIAGRFFDRFSFDLIYARPGQSPAEWRAELRQGLARARDHISLYQLTIEPDTIYARLFAAGKIAMPDEDTARALWDITQEETERRGLPAYEVSNHARPGAESRHNLVYWRYGEYAGVGPGAHGRLLTGRGRLAQATEKHPEMWMTAVKTDGHAIIEEEILSAEAQGDEFLLMGMRLREGIDPARFQQLRGQPLSPSRIASLREDGMIEIAADGRIRATRAGMAILDAVVADLAS